MQKASIPRTATNATRPAVTIAQDTVSVSDAVVGETCSSERSICD